MTRTQKGCFSSPMTVTWPIGFSLPKKHVDKTYFVRLRDELIEEDCKKLCEGVDIGEKNPTLPAVVTKSEKESRECCITIREGKFHQVKRMFAAVDNEVVYLKRLSMGSLIWIKRWNRDSTGNFPGKR